MILHLTTIGPWKRLGLLSHPFGWSRDPDPTPPCTPLTRDGSTAAHITLYPCRLFDHSSICIFSVSAMISNPLRSTSWRVCYSLQPLSSGMLSVPMLIPCGRVVRSCGGGGYVCRKTSPCEGGREKVIGILAKAKKEGKRRKSLY